MDSILPNGKIFINNESFIVNKLMNECLGYIIYFWSNEGQSAEPLTFISLRRLIKMAQKYGLNPMVIQ